MTVIAGTGEPGFSGDGGPATQARLKNPEWLVLDPQGNLILADRGNYRVRRIDARTGVITTIAGTGRMGFSGDGGPATQADMTHPFGLAYDRQGNLFVFDTEVHRIRRIDAATGVITTVIGNGERGFSGDGGPATQAMMYRPHNGVFAPGGDLIFGDSFNQRIRRWNPRTGIITTIAGIGTEGSSPYGTPADSARFSYFGAMVIDRNGDLIWTSLDNRILKLEMATRRVRVIAGTGEAGSGGDGGPAARAQMNIPYGLAIAGNGDLIFSDARNGRIRRIDMRSGVIRTISP
jgi:sugar lactone lactonase YvrE